MSSQIFLNKTEAFPYTSAFLYHFQKVDIPSYENFKNSTTLFQKISISFEIYVGGYIFPLILNKIEVWYKLLKMSYALHNFNFFKSLSSLSQKNIYIFLNIIFLNITKYF